MNRRRFKTSTIAATHEMKSSFAPLLLALPLILAVPGAAQTLESPMGRQLDSQTALLRVQPAVGARYRVRHFSRTETLLPTTSTATGGTAITITKATLDLDVTGRDQFGGSTLRLTYRAFVVQSSGTFYQALPTERRRALEQQDVEMRAALVGQSFSLKVPPNGALWSVVVPSKVREAFKNRVSSSLLSVNTVSLFANQINGQRNKNHADAALPTAPVSLGDSWDYSVLLLTLDNFPFLLSGQRTLKSINAGVAAVAESGAVSISPQTPPGLKTPPGLINLTGTLTGYSRLEIASGLPLETNLTARAAAQLLGSGESKSDPISMSVQDRLVVEPR